LVISIFFFLTTALIGWRAHDDFGVSQDEPAVLKFGLDTWLYIFHDGNMPSVLDWKFYNPIIQGMLAGLINLFQIQDIHQVWSLNHYLMFLVFLSGVAAFVTIARRLTDSIWWAILGALWLICTPRIFAHAFVNPKDIPALTFFTFSILTLLNVLYRPTIPHILLHSLVCAFSISTRIFGVIVPLLTVGYFVDFALPFSISSLKRAALRICLHVFLVAIFTVAIWPALWDHPIKMLVGAMVNSTSRGAGVDLPWYYVPLWMAITIPITYSVFFVIGIVVVLREFFQSPIPVIRRQIPVIATIWLLAPIVAQILFNIGIFNEWRHLLFIYPAFILLSLVGVIWIYNKFSNKVCCGLIICLTIGTLLPVTWMWRNHGLEQMYFSVPTYLVIGNFEGDYWSLSYRQGVEWIVENDSRSQIVLYGVSKQILDSISTMGTVQRSRVKVTRRPEDADYILDNYVSTGYKPILPDTELVHAIFVDGIRVLGIYEGHRTYELESIVIPHE